MYCTLSTKDKEIVHIFEFQGPMVLVQIILASSQNLQLIFGKQMVLVCDSIDPPILSWKGQNESKFVDIVDEHRLDSLSNRLADL